MRKELKQSINNPSLSEFLADNTGDPLDIQSRKQFHFMFWEQAAKAYQSSQYQEALIWYNYSLSLFPNAPTTGDKNLAKLQVHMYTAVWYN